MLDLAAFLKDNSRLGQLFPLLILKSQVQIEVNRFTHTVHNGILMHVYS